LGEPHVNVLKLNLAVDKASPAQERSETKENPTAAEVTPAPPAPAVGARVATVPVPATVVEPPPAAPAPPVAAAAVFPSELSPAHAGEKPGMARLKTCSDQYHANAATNSNGGLKRNVYVIECKKRLKG
jgi:hypothetical protein